MTDSFNTSIEEDKNITDSLLTQGDFDAINNNSSSSKTKTKARARSKKSDNLAVGIDEKGNENNSVSFAELYEEGVAHFTERQLIVENSFGGIHCGHEIWVRDKPIDVPGITYPNWFLPYRPIFNNDDFKQLESAYNGLKNETLKEFWKPLIWPGPPSTPLSQYSQRLCQMKLAESRYTLTDSFKYMHTHDPSEKGSFGQRAANPKTWIPAIEWFDEKLVAEVDFDKIFCLFPKAERNILKLWLGRVAVGRSNHIPPNSPGEDPITHTARMAVIILSREAGIGKSTITNYLYGALNKCGFSVESFKDTKDRFGMGQAAMAHILQKDDVSEESLLRFLQAEETKILVSNGSLRVEEKFQAAETIFPRCSILLNSNSWSSNYAYRLDPGIQSRIKCLSTYSRAELLKLKPAVFNGECPDLRPFAMMPWLAKKYNVSIDAIMLLAARYAADYFYDTITKNEDASVNSLEEEVYTHTSRLRYRFKNDILSSFVQALALSSAFMSLLRGDKPFLPEFNFRMLYDFCKDFYFLSVDPSTVDYCTLLKNHWTVNGSTTSHPYQALRDIRLDTLKQALSWAQEEYIEVLNGNITLATNENEVLKKFVGFIMMRDGFKLSSSVTYFIDAINSISYQADDIFKLASQLLFDFSANFPDKIKIVEKYAHGSIKKADDDWMLNSNYSPKIAEILRREA